MSPRLTTQASNLQNNIVILFGIKEGCYMANFNKDPELSWNLQEDNIDLLAIAA